jgi:hypothetical protein
MEWFGLFIGHLMGDYWPFQNDWMAKNKSNPYPEKLHKGVPSLDYIYAQKHKDGTRNWWIGHLACTLHCLLYTFSIFLFSFWWFPWWGYLICFLVHWPIDRFRLAKWIMVHTGQKEFATGALSPWSVILVDNSLHLLTLFLIGVSTHV